MVIAIRTVDDRGVSIGSAVRSATANVRFRLFKGRLADSRDDEDIRCVCLKLKVEVAVLPDLEA